MSFIDVLKACRFGLEELRFACGRETLAGNKGVTEKLFTRHRRWKSDKAKGNLIEDDLKSLSSVTKHLNQASPLYPYS